MRRGARAARKRQRGDPARHRRADERRKRAANGGRSIAQDEEAAERLKGLQEALGSWLRGEIVPRTLIGATGTGGNDSPRPNTPKP